MRSARRFRLFPAVSAAALCAALVSCEIHYNSFEDHSADVPEFVLENAVIERYEKSLLRVRAGAALVEQYKRQNVYYARDVSCEIFDEAGELQSTASFGEVSADVDAELYTLHGAIRVENHAENTKVAAEALQWSGKTGLLSGDARGSVTIERGGTAPFSFTGRGFSADTFSRTYRFRAVTGRIDSGAAEPDAGGEERDSGAAAEGAP